MAEKTEKATPKKLRDARKKGQLAKSQDLPSAFTFIASICILVAMSGYLFKQLGEFLTSTFKMVPQGNLEVAISALFTQSFIVIFVCSIPILGAVAAIGCLINFLSVGPVFAPEVFKFDPKKFDPIQNLKALFKMKTLFELIKSCLKISIASYLIYGVMYNSIPVLIKTVSMPMSAALLVFNTFLMEVVMKVGLFFIIVAVIDFIYQKRNFAKEMMMEKFEVKQEYKNTEGDPHIKGERKRVAQEIAYSDGPAGGVKSAKAVVTNPTHLAIAIGYEKDLDMAPYIVAMGKDMLAERMIRLAEQYNVPVVRNIKLAHKLWDDGDLYEYVPEETYEAIAEILRWIQSLNTENEFELSNE